MKGSCRELMKLRKAGCLKRRKIRQKKQWSIDERIKRNLAFNMKQRIAKTSMWNPMPNNWIPKP